VPGERIDQHPHDLPHGLGDLGPLDLRQRRANAPVAAVGLALEQRVEDGFPVRKMLVRRPNRESGALRGGRILKCLLDNDKDLSSKCRAALQQPNR